MLESVLHAICCYSTDSELALLLGAGETEVPSGITSRTMIASPLPDSSLLVGYGWKGASSTFDLYKSSATRLDMDGRELALPLTYINPVPPVLPVLLCV